MDTFDDRPASRPSGLSGERVHALLRGVAIGAMVAATVLILAAPTTAQAEPPADGCADTAVFFARGTFEPAGIGAVGQGFVDALRARTGPLVVDVQAVDYPASLDFARAGDGVADASRRVRDIATRCPGTDIVLGGYSQGAAVISYLTTDTLPTSFPLPAGITETLPNDIGEHISAVALFGTPSPEFLNFIFRPAPPIDIGPAYENRTIELCAPADPVCEVGGWDRDALSAYVINGMTDRAAEFTAERLRAAA